MADTINGRTPQTIKKRIGCWNAFRQRKCPAAKDITFKEPGACKNCALRVQSYTVEQATVDILEYVEQLERERDAAVEAQPKWISVEERLPEYDTKVLVVIPRYYGCDIRTARLYKSGAWLIGDMSAVGSTPTHWMPLPEPPKEEA